MHDSDQQERSDQRAHETRTINITNRNENYGTFRHWIKCINAHIILIYGNHEKLLFLLQNPTALNQRES